MTGFVDDPKALHESGVYYPIETHVFAEIGTYETKSRRTVAYQESAWPRKAQLQASFSLPALRLDLVLEP